MNAVTRGGTRRTSRPRLAALAVPVALALAAGGTPVGSDHSDHAPLNPLAGNRRAVIDVREPDRGLPGTGNPAQEAYADRALPRGYVSAQDVQRSQSAFAQLPKKDASWTFIGPSVATAPGPVTESLRDSITSGRITALAIDPNCGAAKKGCRLWVAAAGGGIWLTDDALAGQASWRPVDKGLPTNAMGSLVLDPTDKSGNTLYAGTGEANAVNQAGLGLYRSTNGGTSWSLVPGSFAVAKDRSIGAVRIDPGNHNIIWLGTALGVQGQSSVNGGAKEPPGAPTLGLYRSTNGGKSFSLALSFDGSPRTPLGGVNDIELDPANPKRVYASFFGYGVWRLAADFDGDSSWHQAFAPADQGNPYERTELALTRSKGKTRAYAADGWFSFQDFDGHGALWRVDNSNVPASTLAGSNDNAGWINLSSPVNGAPGFASYALCQSQCEYDLFVEVDPRRPDVVWFGGSMRYDEIRPLQDLSLVGVSPNRSNGRSVMRSADAGVHFTDMTADTRTPHYEQMHPDQHAVVFAPRNTDIAFVGSDGGLVRTNGTYDDASGSCDTRDGVAASPVDLAECKQWLSQVPHRIVNLNAGLATIQFVSLSVDPRHPKGELLGGTQDNGTFDYTGNNKWFESVNGDGGDSGFDATDPNVRVHTYFLGLTDVNHHGADPLTWAFIGQPLLDSFENVSFYTPLLTDPVVSGTIFVGQQHVWRTQDNGGPKAELEAHCASPGGVPEYDGTITCGDFQPLGPDLTDASLGDRNGQYVVAVKRATSDHSTLWSATRLGRLFVSKNADAAPDAVTFARIDTHGTPGRFVSGIAVDPADANHAFVSYSGYQAATPNTPQHVLDVHFDPATGSATFADLSYNLGDMPITDVALDSVRHDLYAATDYGVAVLPKGATTWYRASGGLPLASVPGLTIVPSARVLYAATYGRSAYRLTLP